MENNSNQNVTPPVPVQPSIATPISSSEAVNLPPEIKPVRKIKLILFALLIIFLVVFLAIFLLLSRRSTSTQQSYVEQPTETPAPETQTDGFLYPPLYPEADWEVVPARGDYEYLDSIDVEQSGVTIQDGKYGRSGHIPGKFYLLTELVTKNESFKLGFGDNDYSDFELNFKYGYRDFEVYWSDFFRQHGWGDINIGEYTIHGASADGASGSILGGIRLASDGKYRIIAYEWEDASEDFQPGVITCPCTRNFRLYFSDPFSLDEVLSNTTLN